MKAAIFDMDGVIVDSEPLHFMVDKIVLKNIGVTESEDYLEKFVGYTNPEMWQQIIYEKKLNYTAEELIKSQIELKLDYLKNNNFNPIDGILDLLIKLDKEQYKMAIASSSPRIFIEAIVKKLRIDNFFSVIISAEEVANGKPEPDVFLKAVELLNIDPSDCFIIEDSKSGVTAANKAGIRCIGFQNPSSGNQDLSGAEITIDKISDISRII